MTDRRPPRIGTRHSLSRDPDVQEEGKKPDFSSAVRPILLLIQQKDDSCVVLLPFHPVRRSIGLTLISRLSLSHVRMMCHCFAKLRTINLQVHDYFSCVILCNRSVLYYFNIYHCV